MKRSTQSDLTDRIKNNSKFKALIRKRGRFGWQIAIAMLIVYYAFILTVAFAPQLLGTPIAAGSSISIGIPLGALVLVIAFVLTGLYVRRANTEFDDLTRQIIDEVR
jgi:uncharacterized membrane protein (DUF485 family)